MQAEVNMKTSFCQTQWNKNVYIIAKFTIVTVVVRKLKVYWHMRFPWVRWRLRFPFVRYNMRFPCACDTCVLYVQFAAVLANSFSHHGVYHDPLFFGCALTIGHHSVQCWLVRCLFKDECDSMYVVRTRLKCGKTNFLLNNLYSQRDHKYLLQWVLSRTQRS